MAFTFGAGERERNSPAPGSSVEVPGPGGWRKSPREARHGPEERRPWEPASRPRRPPSPSLLPGCARAAAALSRGLRREPSSRLHGTLLQRTCWRSRGSAVAQAVSSEVRPRVAVHGPPSFAQPSWLESATSPRCFSLFFFFQYATKPCGRVSFFPPCFCREGDTY